jgi:transposase-like protein/ribosomal protein L37AE/L43A
MQEFMDRFSTDEKCRQYLIDVRWADGFKCPKCLHNKVWYHSRGILRCSTCSHDVSVTAGTIFQDRHLSLRLWFQAVWLVVSQKNGVSALGLSRALGIKRQKTGWQLLRKIRTAMVRVGRERLSGTVEVDEVFVGGVKPGKRGRGALGKVLALVAVEDKGKAGIGRIRIEIILDASASTLKSAIGKMVEPGSTIRTDEWKGYTAVALHGYKHTIIEKKSLEPGEDPTPLVHRIASLLKRWLLGTHQGGVRLTHIRSYLDEFIFRFNRRTSHSRGKLFFRLIQGMIQ